MEAINAETKERANRMKNPCCSDKEKVSSHEEQHLKKNMGGDNMNADKEEERVILSNHLEEHHDGTSEGEGVGSSLKTGKVISSDIRFYLKENKVGQAVLRAKVPEMRGKDNIRLEDYEGRNDRMRFMRDKMKIARERKQFNSRLKNSQQSRQTETVRGKRLLEGREVQNKEMIQDEEMMVIVGSDVEALYPSLSDVEVALICFDAIMNSDINFQMINFRVAGKYVAMHLSKEEQLLSPLRRILPVRTAKGGVRPGVSAAPGKDENWSFPISSLTEYEERLLVAMTIQIGVVIMMNSHSMGRHSYNVLVDQLG